MWSRQAINAQVIMVRVVTHMFSMSSFSGVVDGLEIHDK